jgi:hypothetical protein
MKAKSDEVRRLFRLPPERQSYDLVYSPMRGAEGELTVNSRSIFQILTTLASYVEAPEDAPPPEPSPDKPVKLGRRG